MDGAQVGTIIGFAALGLVVYIYVAITTYKALYKKVGPNEALVIAGGKGEWITDERGERHRIGFRIVKGGGTLVNPLTERAEVLSLELVRAETKGELTARTGIP